MVRIITLNLNGIRSAWRKGVLPWVSGQNADIVCVQELKAQAADLDEEMNNPDGLHAYYRHAERKGYSGVGLWCRKQPERVFDLLGNDEFDGEGRYLRADFGGLSIVSLYQPSGSSLEHLVELAASGREVIVCGDWNIAHQEIDLRNWRSNRRNSGFLPAERAWVSRLLNEAGWSDVYRKLHPAATDEAYTWWSNRGQAWAKNVGWRLDYQLATAAVASQARRAVVYKEQRFSDHAPLSIDYDYHLQTGPTGCTPL